jgi:hypothetical protein
LAQIPNPLPYVIDVWRWGWGLERGVKLFGLFLVAFILGGVFALVGWAVASVLSGLVAVISLVAMALTPSPQVLARRLVLQVQEEGEEGEAEEDDDVDEGIERSVTSVLAADAPSAPTSSRPSVPEPPSMDIIIDAKADEADAEDGEEDGLWVEA